MMIDIWGVDKFISYCEMNCFKYRMRLGNKPGENNQKELSKIKWYENKIKELKKNNVDSNTTHINIKYSIKTT